MRIVNISPGVRNVQRPAALGQYGAYQTSYTTPREVAFRFIDEEGWHNVAEGKKFPYTVSNVVSTGGAPLISGPVKGTALSGEGTVVRVAIPIPQGQGNVSISDQPVSAVLSLYGVKDGAQYTIFENRKILFTVAPASPLPLDLGPIYAKYEADKYAAETAAQDEIMGQKYEAMLATEAQAKAASEKAKAAAEVATALKQAADEAIAIALNEKYEKNKLLLVVGGVAALGLLAYLVWGD